MQVIAAGNPFVLVDKQTVIGTLKATNSRDLDVLHATKRNLISNVSFPRLAGNWLMFLGALVSLTIIGLFIGVPFLIAGWWLRGRGTKNVKAVETAYSEYVAQLGI
jgi:hypothetical protein